MLPVAAVADGLISKYLWRRPLHSTLSDEAFLDSVPERTFGVFATVTRGGGGARAGGGAGAGAGAGPGATEPQTDRRATTNTVHGCMGSWVRGKDLSAKNILTKAKRSLYNAIFEDPRRFKIPVWQDDSAVVDISFMVGDELLAAGAPFLPSVQGIIVEFPSSSRTATFLPGVFDEGTPLDKIKHKLIEKAGGGGEDEGEGEGEGEGDGSEYKLPTFIVYSVKRISATMKELVLYSIAFTSGPMFVDTYLGFIEKHTSPSSSHIEKRKATDSAVAAGSGSGSGSGSAPDLPPYLVDSEGKVSTDGMQFIRNASVAADVLDIGSRRALIPWAESFVAHHFGTLDGDDKGAVLAQATSFVAHHLPLVTPACRLMQSVLLSLDSTFALPEVLLGLVRTRCHLKTSTLPRAMSQLRTAIETLDVERNPSACFALNWASQVAIAYADRPLTSIVSSQWLRWIASVFLANHPTAFESNELVVVFEGLSHMIMGGKSRPEFVRVWLVCLYTALSRLDAQNGSGLIAFTDGTARIDVTSHMVRGIQLVGRCRSSITTTTTTNHLGTRHRGSEESEKIGQALLRSGENGGVSPRSRYD